ncbi:hypothetical protein GQ600_228 [Phytophthora cactorum]|nr:hypothetical protein GQ600_228 [Phytophthora cactorum]
MSSYRQSTGGSGGYNITVTSPDEEAQQGEMTIKFVTWRGVGVAEYSLQPQYPKLTAEILAIKSDKGRGGEAQRNKYSESSPRDY